MLSFSVLSDAEVWALRSSADDRGLVSLSGDLPTSAGPLCHGPAACCQGYVYPFALSHRTTLLKVSFGLVFLISKQRTCC